MKNFRSIALISLLLIAVSFALTGCFRFREKIVYIDGVVVDEEGNPIENIIVESGCPEVTQADGSFSAHVHLFSIFGEEIALHFTDRYFEHDGTLAPRYEDKIIKLHLKNVHDGAHNDIGKVALTKIKDSEK